MILSRKTALLGLAALTCGLPQLALAGNYEACEIVIMTEKTDEDGGTIGIAAFEPADDFLKQVKNAEPVPEANALMCKRNDLVPVEADYAVLATGTPLALSQDFDSADSDSLTIFFKDGRFDYKYASAYPMGEEFKTELEQRLEDFSSRDHGLSKSD